MAEYAGLEIRIGGNTTKLNNALKASTKSAAELQSRIRQITKAMQFDPTNLKNVETRVKITGDRMQSLQSKAQITRTAMEQLGKTMTTFRNADGTAKTVRDVAESTDNLSLKAKQADERFNKLTGSLAQVYEAWNRLSRDRGSDYLVDQIGLSRDEADQLMRSTTSVREFVSVLREEQRVRSDLSYSGDKPLITEQEIEMAKSLKGLDFHGLFKRGLDLDDVIQEAEKLGVVIEDSAIANVRELQSAFRDAQQEKKGFDDALRYEQMATDLQRLDSEAESLSQTMRKLDDSLNPTVMSEGFQLAETRVRSLDAMLDNIEHDLERTGAAMKADPTNVQLAARYYGDLQQKAALSEEKVSLLNRQMGMLDASGASKAASRHKDLAKWIEESAESARKAKKEYSDQQATVANLTDQTKGLQQAIAMVKGDHTIAGYSDAVLEWNKRTKELESAMERLANREQDVTNNQKALTQAQINFDEAKKGAKELSEQLESLRKEYAELDAVYRQVYDDPNVDFDTKLGMYNRLQELPGEIQRVENAYNSANAKVEGFNDALAAQQERVKIAKSALEQQQERVGELKKAVAKLEESSEVKLFRNPNEELGKAEKELEGLRKQLGEALVEEKRLASAYKAAETENELAKTAHALQDTSQEANDAKMALKQVQDELKGENAGILNASTIKSIGMTFSATLTPLLTGLAYNMADAGSEVDSAYRDMRKTVEGTEEQFERLRQSAIDFSRTHVTSADQILQIEAIGGELGVATDSLQTFAEVISNIDVATNLDVESAADALGHLSNILNLTEDDYVGFSDALVRLGNNGASTESEIANIAERIGSMASIVNMSAPDVLAWASSIASTGQNAEAAGTAISKTMSFFETAVASAGGTIDTSFDAISAAVQNGGSELVMFSNLMGQTADEFAEAWESDPKAVFEEVTDAVDGAKNSLQGIADVAHMTADEFAQTWESDPTAAMEAFIKGLNDVEKAEGSADRVLQGFKITSVRQKQAIEGLMRTIGGLDDNLEMSRNAWNGVSDEWGRAGDAANEAQKKAEGFSGQLSIMKNMWQNMLAELSEGAVPWIQRFTGILQYASEAFSGLSSDTKQWIVAAGGIAAAIGPLLSVVGTFGTARKEFKDWYETTVSGMNFMVMAAKMGTGTLEKAMSGTMTTMEKVGVVAGNFGQSLLKGLATGSVVAGIAVIGYALYQMYEQYKEHIAATEGLTSAIAGIGSVSNHAVGGIDSVKMSTGELMENASEAEGRLADLAKTLADSNRQYDAYAGPLEGYARTVETLGGKAERSKDETNKLAAALQGINDACGTNYALDEYGNIIDTETGKIQENNEVIRANIELRKQQALIDYYSDDYAKAIGQQEDARQAVYGLAEEYRRLRTEAGKQDWIDNYIEKTGRADLAEEAFKGHLDRVKISLEQSKNEFTKTSEVVNNLDGRMADATERMNKANETIEATAKAQEEYDKRTETVAADVTGNMKKLSDAVESVGGSDEGFNSIVDGLDAISVSASEMNDVDMSGLASAFDDAGGSMAEVISTLEDGGVVMDTWNDALEQAPDAAQYMSSVTASAFQSMYNIAGQNINDTMTLIAGLDTVIADVDGEQVTFYIGDNGSIVDSKGKVYDLKRDMNALPKQVLVKVQGDNKDAESKIKQTDASRKNLDGSNANVSITASDSATAKIDSVERAAKRLDGTTSTTYIKTVYKTSGKKPANADTQATGGLNSRPVIPMHASGYIATGPTLTNQGWIGEDGIEVVANWATGGAVVPLTNKRYMLPIADAIAEGMARRDVGNSGTHITVTVSGVASPNEVADAIARRLGPLMSL